MRFFRKLKKGFTLVELVVVIAVIAILAAVSVGAYFGITDSANNSKLEQETKQLLTNIQAVSLGTSDNQSLDISGLKVDDIDQFERDLEENAGRDFEVLTIDPLLLSRATIVLKDQSQVNSRIGRTINYTSFEYYNPDISGKKVVVSDIKSGKMDIVKIDAIPVNKKAEDVSNTLVYAVDELNWGKMYVYAWTNLIDEHGNSTGVLENGGFNATEMISLGDNIYAAYLTSTFKNCIFNNGGNLKTEDLTIPAKDEANYYYTEQKVWGNAPTEVPDVAAMREVYFTSYLDEVQIHAWGDGYGNTDYDMEPVEGIDNLFKAEIPEYLTGLLFWNKDHTIKTSDLSFDGYDAAANKICWDGTSWIEVPTTNVTYEFNTMYAILSEYVDNPRIYVNGGFEYILENTTLPMTKVENADYNIWKFEFVNKPTNFNIEWMIEDTKHEIGYKAFDWSEKYSYYESVDQKWIDAPGSSDYYDPQFVAPESVNITGTIGGNSDNHWKENFPLTSEDEGLNWNIKMELLAGTNFKLREGDTFDKQWDSTCVRSENNALVEGEKDKNIEVKQTAYYSISLNAKTGKITYEILEDVYSVIGTINGGNWDVDIPLTKTDTPNVYTITLTAETAKVGDEFKIRRNYAWNTSYGFGDIGQKSDVFNAGNDGNIEINKAGEHTITLNISNNKAITYVTSVEEVFDEPLILYLKPNSNWHADNARFAAYFFGNGDTWLDLVDTDSDGYYEVEAPKGYTSVIFCRMNPSTTANNWGNKWNQTGDLTVPTDGTNCYTVKENTWDEGGGSWSTYTPA